METGDGAFFSFAGPLPAKARPQATGTMHRGRGPAHHPPPPLFLLHPPSHRGAKGHFGGGEEEAVGEPVTHFPPPPPFPPVRESAREEGEPCATGSDSCVAGPLFFFFFFFPPSFFFSFFPVTIPRLREDPSTRRQGTEFNCFARLPSPRGKGPFVTPPLFLGPFFSLFFPFPVGPFRTRNGAAETWGSIAATGTPSPSLFLFPRASTIAGLCHRSCALRGGSPSPFLPFFFPPGRGDGWVATRLPPLSPFFFFPTGRYEAMRDALG